MTDSNKAEGAAAPQSPERRLGRLIDELCGRGVPENVCMEVVGVFNAADRDGAERGRLAGLERAAQRCIVWGRQWENFSGEKNAAHMLAAEIRALASGNAVPGAADTNIQARIKTGFLPSAAGSTRTSAVAAGHPQKEDPQAPAESAQQGETEKDNASGAPAARTRDLLGIANHLADIAHDLLHEPTNQQVRESARAWMGRYDEFLTALGERARSAPSSIPERAGAAANVEPEGSEAPGSATTGVVPGQTQGCTPFSAAAAEQGSTQGAEPRLDIRPWCIECKFPWMPAEGENARTMPCPSCRAKAAAGAPEKSPAAAGTHDKPSNQADPRPSAIVGAQSAPAALSALDEGVPLSRASMLRLLSDGYGPGGGYYEPDQRLGAAVSLLQIGWGSAPPRQAPDSPSVVGLQSDGFAEAAQEFTRQLIAWREAIELLKQARYWLAAAVVPAPAVREPLLARIDRALDRAAQEEGKEMDSAPAKGET